MSELTLLVLIVFGIFGLVGTLIFLRIPNLIIVIITALVSFALPWLIFRPVGAADLLLALVAWGVGALLAYLISRHIPV